MPCRHNRVLAEPLLTLRHVNVTRNETQVLSDINLDIRAGEQVAILGPNGCGKSTLLKTITCELYPLARPETRVMIFGRERWDLTELKRRLGVVQAELPGRPMLKLSGFDAVLTGFFSSSTLWPHLAVTQQMRERASEVLALLGATGFADKLFGELSAGQQRRILIARALVVSTNCLLLDEPSNALDLAAQRALREVLERLAGHGTSILQITHNVADILPAMRRVILMRAGRIFADGDRDQLLTESSLSELFQVRVRLRQDEGIVHAW